MLLRHEILPRITTPPKTIPPAAAMIALARILAAVPTAAETVAGIAAGVAVGDGVVDANGADALRLARVDPTCLRRNMHPRQAAKPPDMTVAADRPDDITIGR